MQRLKNRYKKYFLVFLTLVLIGFLLGVIYYNLQSSLVKESIITSITNYTGISYNSILKDLIITSILLVSSFLIFGLPLSIFYLFYEGFSLGFLLASFYSALKIKGLIYILIYILINKLIYLILIIFFIQKLMNITRFIIGLIIYKNDSTLKDKIINNFRNALFIIIFILIIDIILYFLSPLIFSYLNFLIH